MLVVSTRPLSGGAWRCPLRQRAYIEISATGAKRQQDPYDLGLYFWNAKVFSNYFRKTCGILAYIGGGENAKDDYRVNLGCVEGPDPPALDISIIDGKSVPLIEPPG